MMKCSFTNKVNRIKNASLIKKDMPKYPEGSSPNMPPERVCIEPAIKDHVLHMDLNSSASKDKGGAHKTLKAYTYKEPQAGYFVDFKG